MPNITNAQVVAFSNQQVRPFADHIYAAYYEAKQLVQNYNAGDIGSKIDAAGAENIVEDGSSSDGRTQITGGDIYNLITTANAFIAFVEGSAVSTAARLDVITKPHVN